MYEVILASGEVIRAQAIHADSGCLSVWLPPRKRWEEFGRVGSLTPLRQTDPDFQLSPHAWVANRWVYAPE